MKFKYLFLAAILVTLSLGRVISNPRHDQEESFCRDIDHVIKEGTVLASVALALPYINLQLSKRLEDVEVDMNTVGTAQDGQRIWTQGLDTCVAVIAIGTPSTTGGIAKVMAHMSTGKTEVMQAWSAQDQASGMTDIVIYMSQPDPSRNLDPTPNRVQEMDISIHQDYNTVYRLLVSTGPIIHNFNTWVREQAHTLMTAGFAMYQRLNRDAESSAPGLGEMESRATGNVIADTHVL